MLISLIIGSLAFHFLGKNRPHNKEKRPFAPVPKAAPTALASDWEHSQQ